MERFKTNMLFGVDAVHTVTGRDGKLFLLGAIKTTEGGSTDMKNLHHWL